MGPQAQCTPTLLLREARPEAGSELGTLTATEGGKMACQLVASPR